MGKSPRECFPSRESPRQWVQTCHLGTRWALKCNKTTTRQDWNLTMKSTSCQQLYVCLWPIPAIHCRAANFLFSFSLFLLFCFPTVLIKHTHFYHSLCYVFHLWSLSNAQVTSNKKVLEKVIHFVYFLCANLTGWTWISMLSLYSSTVKMCLKMLKCLSYRERSFCGMLYLSKTSALWGSVYTVLTNRCFIDFPSQGFM